MFCGRYVDALFLVTRAGQIVKIGIISATKDDLQSAEHAAKPAVYIAWISSDTREGNYYG